MMQSVFDIQKILEMMPHRYPFLLIDRVIELVPREKIVALKNVSINEPFFQGHFPGMPHRQWLRMQRVLPELPELKKRLAALEKEMARLSGEAE